jgi:hypothetical protein
MADNPTGTVRLVNRRDQPVELHRGTEVVVIPPLGSLVLASDLARTPQIEVLIRHRLLAMRPVGADAGPAGEALPPDATKPPKSRKKGGEKGAGT